MFPTSRPLLFAFTALLGLAGSLGAQNTFAPTEAAQKEAAAYLQPLPKDRVVPYKVIAGDFAANEAAAAGKYGGRRITVIGHISKLSKSSSENKALVVRLQGASASLPAVKAEFLSGSLPENADLEVSQDGSQATLIRRDRVGNILSREPYLSIGQRVGIKGTFKDLNVGDIVLTACSLVPKEKLRAE